MNSTTRLLVCNDIRFINALFIKRVKYAVAYGNGLKFNYRPAVYETMTHISRATSTGLCLLNINVVRYAIITVYS